MRVLAVEEESLRYLLASSTIWTFKSEEIGPRSGIQKVDCLIFRFNY